MVNSLVFTDIPQKLNPLLTYSKLFSIEFYIATTQEQVLSTYVRQQPALLIAHCSDDSLQNLRFLRQLAANLPILLLSEKRSEAITITAFEAGASYILHHPCSSKELYYHLRNLLQLTKPADVQAYEHVMNIGNLRIYLRSNQVMVNDAFVPLTNMEYKLLLLFVNNLNHTIPVNKLYKQLYSSEDLKFTSRAIQMHISNLRRKLGLNGTGSLRLETLHGTGYVLREQSLEIDERRTRNDHTEFC